MADTPNIVQGLPSAAPVTRPDQVLRTAKKSPQMGRERRHAPSASQQRLVVVLNRVPVPKDRSTKAGGLTVALEGALRQSGGLWSDGSGETTEEPSVEPKIV
jgi:trehalose 6-phosphate synthase